MASENQINYIKSLIAAKRGQYWRKADGIRATTADLAAHDSRHAAAALRDAELMVLAYETIRIPSDLSEKQASVWIEALKAAGNKIIEAALDKPETAARIGLADLIAEHGAELEKVV